MLNYKCTGVCVCVCVCVRARALARAITVRAYVRECPLVQLMSVQCAFVHAPPPSRVPARTCVQTKTLLYPSLRYSFFFFTFNTDTTTITKFTLSSSDRQLEVNENTPVIEARCVWAEGNPQRRILLRKDSDKPLAVKETAEGRSSSLVHNINFVRCSEAGQYRCEVEGSDQHRTVTLLVRCKYSVCA